MGQVLFEKEKILTAVTFFLEQQQKKKNINVHHLLQIH